MGVALQLGEGRLRWQPRGLVTQEQKAAPLPR